VGAYDRLALAVSRHRAVVVTTPTAAREQQNGGSLRAAAVTQLLRQAGFAVTRVTPHELGRLPGGWCLGVAVSYAVAGAVGTLQQRAGHVWVDAVDSWLLMNASGVLHGHPSYVARLARDAWRLARMPPVDMVTYISRADLVADRGTVRGRARLVLPATAHEQHHVGARAGEGRRAVVAGDWGYPPNRDGFRWFRARVLPRLEPLLAGLDWRVDVYGEGPPGTHPHAHLRGFVEDLGDLYREGDVHVVPVRFGAGVKNKAVQPLMAGLPVVTTPAGAHGLVPHPLLDVRRSSGAFAAALASRLHARTPTAPSRSPVDADDTARLLAVLATVACPCR
jgi:hypothetical protein